MNRSRNYYGLRLGLTALGFALMAYGTPARAQEPQECAPGDGLCELKHNDEDEGGGTLAEESKPNGIGSDTYAGPGFNNPKPGQHDNGRGGNTFVNDPCLDPPPDLGPPSNVRTVQSETEIAILNSASSHGKKMVAGYNDSYGFYDNREGLSGYAYSTNGGNTWIDGGGLPPVATNDHYFGDPVVVVHNATETFYYASIYQLPNGTFSLTVNRGRFQADPPQGVESVSNTRCLRHPEEYLVPDPPSQQKERIHWEPPVVAVVPVNPAVNAGSLIDKEWLYVDQNTGELYLTYTRFAGSPTFETPIELVRSFDGGQHWTAPTIIVANEDFDFNQATQAYKTPSGRLIVTWNRRRFDDASPFPEIESAIEYAYSDADGAPLTFTTELLVAKVNPQGEPPGYNRGRTSILNAPYIFVDRGSDDGVFTAEERSRAGFGNVYITYFSGKTPLPIANVSRAADIYVSRSTNNGTSFVQTNFLGVKVNDDAGTTSHVFPAVQVNKLGDVYVGWVDRRNDPADNLLTDAWANVSKDNGVSYGHDKLQSDVATTWFIRRDAAPNFGDYNSAELLDFNQFVMVWSDGRFPAQLAVDPTLISFQRRATPDMIFSIANGLGAAPPKPLP